jgi:hypothetical protein
MTADAIALRSAGWQGHARAASLHCSMVYFAAQRRSLRLGKDGAGITSAAQRRTIMSTTTTTLDARDSVGETGRSGWLERLYRRLLASREAHARAIVDAHLARLPDASLVDLGFEQAQIRRIRAKAGTTAMYWI